MRLVREARAGSAGGSSVARRAKQQLQTPTGRLQRGDALGGRRIDPQRVDGQRFRKHWDVLDHDSTDVVGLRRVDDRERVQDVDVIPGLDQPTRR